jgi:transposase-like protein
MEKHTCPHCKFSGTLVKAGRNRTGSQRFLCRACGRSCTPELKAAGHDDAKRVGALRCYAAGMGVRASKRCVGVNQQTVVNWVKAACAEAEQEREDGTLEPGSLLSHLLLRRTVELEQRERDEAARLRRALARRSKRPWWLS